MALSELSFLPTSRGTLLRLRQQLELVRRGRDILEMRREQLIREIFHLMNRLKARPEAENELLRALRKLAALRVARGEQEFMSATELFSAPRVDIVLVSYQGVPVPQARIIEEPDFSQIADPEYHAAFEMLWKATKELIEIANMECAVEKLSEQLGYINRVVNSMNRSIIPKLEETIRYIEEKLEEESIGEFVRIRETVKRG